MCRRMEKEEVGYTSIFEELPRIKASEVHIKKTGRRRKDRVEASHKGQRMSPIEKSKKGGK